MLAAVNVLDATSLVSAFGLVGVMLVLFAETGLLVGFFLPGDSLLFVAGLAAAGGLADQGIRLPLGWLLVAGVVGALVGAQTGYLVGARAGPRLFDRPEGRLFRQSHVKRADEFLHRFGAGRAVVLARFVPIVRTLMNPLAGVVGMPARQFALWQVVGGLAWVVGVTLLGYFLGNVAFIKNNLEALILAVVAVSVVPIAAGLYREYRRAR